MSCFPFKGKDDRTSEDELSPILWVKMIEGELSPFKGKDDRR